MKKTALKAIKRFFNKHRKKFALIGGALTLIAALGLALFLLPSNGILGEIKGKVRNDANLIVNDDTYKRIDDQEYAGVTVTVNDDGSLKLDGKATGSTSFVLLTRPGGFGENVHMSLGKVNFGKNAEKTHVTVYNGSTLTATSSANSAIAYSASGTNTWEVKIEIVEGDTFDNVTIYPMLNYGSTAAPYYAIN